MRTLYSLELFITLPLIRICHLPDEGARAGVFMGNSGEFDVKLEVKVLSGNLGILGFWRARGGERGICLLRTIAKSLFGGRAHIMSPKRPRKGKEGILRKAAVGTLHTHNIRLLKKD